MYTKIQQFELFGEIECARYPYCLEEINIFEEMILDD